MSCGVWRCGSTFDAAHPLVSLRADLLPGDDLVRDRRADARPVRGAADAGGRAWLGAPPPLAGGASAPRPAENRRRDSRRSVSDRDEASVDVRDDPDPAGAADAGGGVEAGTC